MSDFHIIQCIIIILLLNSCSGTEKRKEYYPDGSVKAEFVTDENGIANGQSVQYDKEGNIWARRMWKNGVLNGESKFYDGKGNLEGVFNYLKGEKDGIAKEFDTTGVLLRQVEFESGKKNGEYYYYKPNSKIEAYGVYDDDVVVYSIRYDENGDTLEVKRKIIADFKVEKIVPKIKVQLHYKIYGLNCDTCMAKVFCKLNDETVVEDRIYPLKKEDDVIIELDKVGKYKFIFETSIDGVTNRVTSFNHIMLIDSTSSSQLN